MTMFMMRPGSQKGDIYQLLWTMLTMSVIEWVFKHAGVWIPAVRDAAAKWATGGARPQWNPATVLGGGANEPRVVISSVTLVRNYAAAAASRVATDFNSRPGAGNPDTTDPFTSRADAVLEFIAGLNVTRHVRLEHRCIVADTDEIELVPLLKARIKNEKGGSSGATEDKGSVEIVLYSTHLQVSEIRAWIEETHTAWVAEKHNKLGNRIFYFNEIPIEPPQVADMTATAAGAEAAEVRESRPRKTYRWDTLPKALTFTMNEFHTNKSFDNVYGAHVGELRDRLDLFVNHPEWYRERGIPHTLGILLHGIPGAGKTSTIKAIARDTRSHIFSLALRPYTSQRQLMNLFYTDAVAVMGSDGNKQIYQIPQSRRLYVIEDIDCLTNVVLDRQIRRAEGLPEEQEGGDAVTLSFLLNLIDGILEMPGRKMVISANYPERLDKALIRPGRIDVRISFGRADREFIAQMMSGFYKARIAADDLPAAIADRFTPAEVTEACCRFYRSSDAAVAYMVAKAAETEPVGTRLEDIVGLTIKPLAEGPHVSGVIRDVVISETPPTQQNPVNVSRDLREAVPIPERLTKEQFPADGGPAAPESVLPKQRTATLAIPTAQPADEFYEQMAAQRIPLDGYKQDILARVAVADSMWNPHTDDADALAGAEFEAPDTSEWTMPSPPQV